MKKLFYLAVASLALASCGDSGELAESAAQVQKNTAEPSTSVYVQGQKISGLSADYSAVATSTADAYFFIRVDSRIPSCESMPADKYFPQRPFSQAQDGFSVFSEGNKGLIDLNYAYKDGSGLGLGKYVYDTEGKATGGAIVKEPQLADILAANLNYNYGDLAAIDTDTLKVLWYVVKFDYGKWHVDGVLTGIHTKSIVEVPGISKDPNFEETNIPAPPTLADPDRNVEVDIHQQKHEDWDEIKTSIHLRDLIENVRVEIPIGNVDIAEADDFAIREYTFYTSLPHLNTTHPIKVIAKHKADKLVFEVACSDTNYINYLKNQYGDGVTIEVHTYTKNLTKEEVWERLKNATVTTDTPTTIKKNVTSAFFTE